MVISFRRPEVAIWSPLRCFLPTLFGGRRCRDGRRGLRVGIGGFVFGAAAPRRPRHELRDAVEDDAQAGRGRMSAGASGFASSSRPPRGDLDEAQTQRVELGDGKAGKLRHRGTQAPHHPVGAGMQEQTELVGRRPAAGCAVAGEMRLPRLDVVLGRAAPAVDVLVERLGLATGKLGTMKRVSVPWAPTSTRAMMRSTRLQMAAPSKNSLKRRTSFVFADASKRTSVLVSRSATLAQRRGGRQPEDEVDIVGAAPIDDRWTAIMSVGPDQDPCSPSCSGSPAPGGAGGGGSQPRSVAWPDEERHPRTGHRHRTPRSAASRIRRNGR